MIRVFAVAAALLATPAFAQESCADREHVLARLANNYGEVPVAVGLSLPDRRDGTAVVVEVLSNPKTGTWTILATLPNGQTCFLAAGEAWQMLPVAPSGEGA